MSSSLLVTHIGELVTLNPLVKAQRLVEITPEDLGLVRNAYLLVENGKIKDFGPMNLCPNNLKDIKKIHAQNGLVLPGLVDNHTHPIFSGSRSAEYALRLKGATYQEIAQAGGGILSTMKATRAASDEILQDLLEKRLNKFKTHGVTTVEIKTGYGLTLKDEYRQAQIIKKAQIHQTLKSTCLALHALPPEFKNNPQNYIQKVTYELLPQLVEEKLIDYVDVFIEEGYFHVSQLEDFFKEVEKLNLGLRVHADEFTHSQGALIASQYKAKSADHLQFTREEDYKKMAQSGVVATLLPGTSLYSHIPYTQAHLARQNKVPIAVATDFNPGSCGFYNLSFIACLACRESGLTKEEALVGITLVAAKSLDLDKHKGALSLSYDADFIIYTTLNSTDEWISNWGQDQPTHVIINGSEKK
jgi:imidazolonepropionase